MKANISTPYFRLALVLSLTMGLWGCAKDKIDNQPINKVSIIGNVEKGPFVQGSTAVIYELNEDFTPTGRTFKTELVDDKGSFSIPNLELKSKYIQVSVNGYYFDEITGRLSSSTLALNATVEVTGNKTINVNILTHLEEKRVRRLVKEGKSFLEAKRQAQTEIYTLFSIRKELIQSFSENVAIIKGDKNSAALLGISSILLYYSGSDNAKLTELLNKISMDLEDDGEIDRKLRIELKNTIGDVNEEQVLLNVKKRYKLEGVIIPFDTLFEVYLEFSPTDPIEEIEYDFALAFKGIIQGHSKNLQHYYFLEGLYTNTIADQKWLSDPFYKRQLTADNQQINNVFSNSYRNILHANYMIRESRKNASDLEKASYQHKVYPIYTLIYWQLINLFGDPIYMHADNIGLEAKPRSRKDEVINELIKNLEKSILELSGKENNLADLGRAVIARLCLEINDNAKARKYLNEVINSNRYQLSLKGDIHNETKETIFGRTINQNIELNDNNENYLQYARKGGHFNYVRYTEVLLLAAEANMKLKENDEALRLLNQVRSRDGEKLITDQQELLMALQMQYKMHLNNEGVYFSFLKRNNLAETALSIESFRKLFPLPLQEVIMNPTVSQNPGY